MLRPQPITVLVVTHRKKELLTNALRAAFGQLGSQDQLLIVDDGGDDEPAVPDEVKCSPLCHYTSIPHNGYRLGEITNRGIKQAVTQAVLKLDGDVILQPGSLKTFREAFAPRTLLMGRIEWERRNGGLRRDGRFDYERGKLRADLMRRDEEGDPLYPQRTWAGAIGFYRDDFLTLGGFDERFIDGGYEESDLGWRAYYAGWNLKFLFDAYTIHQWHPRTRPQENAQRNWQLMLKNRRLYRQQFQENDTCGTAHPGMHFEHCETLQQAEVEAETGAERWQTQLMASV